MTRKASIWIVLGFAAAVVAWQLGSLAQNAALAQGKGVPKTAPDKAAGARFEFQVIESTDAKYLGDTPSHHGRSGLKGKTPNLALQDPVFRGTTMIGRVTSIQWDKTKEALDVEFNPEPLRRVSVGDTVWVVIDGSEPPTSEE
jgi:hypothetical protein